MSRHTRQVPSAISLQDLVSLTFHPWCFYLIYTDVNKRNLAQHEFTIAHCYENTMDVNILQWCVYCISVLKNPQETSLHIYHFICLRIFKINNKNVYFTMLAILFWCTTGTLKCMFRCKGNFSLYSAFNVRIFFIFIENDISHAPVRVRAGHFWWLILSHIWEHFSWTFLYKLGVRK